MDFFTGPVIASIITFTGTIIVACISINNNRKTTKDNKKLIERTDLIEKRKIVERKLDEFYLPLRHHLEQSKTLFKIFMKDKPKGFRTLTHLLHPKEEYGDEKLTVELSPNDNSLLSMIIEIGKRIENLLLEKSYLIGDDSEFTKVYEPSEDYAHIHYDKGLTLTSLLISHIVTIRLAFEGKLSGQVSKFEGYVFPNEINPTVDKKIAELEDRIREYDSNVLRLIK